MKKLLLILLLLAGQVFGQGYGPASNSGSIVDRDSGESVRVTNGGLDVNIQDQYTRALDLRFLTAVGAPTTLGVATIVDAHTITLADATGFVAGTYIVVAEAGDKFFVGTQLGAAVGNIITLDSPIDQVYAFGSVVINASYDMAVKGDITPVVFQVSSSGSTITMDLTRILGYMQDDTAMEDSRFAGGPPLTNGCVLRVSNGAKTNVWNVKTNADLALLGFDFMYTEKAPAGSYGARFRISYAGREKHGVTIRLGPGEFLEFIIQDDLTGLEVFNMMAQGHIVE